MELLSWAKQELDTVKRAPVTCVACAVVGWFLCSNLTNIQLEAAKEQTTSAHERIAICQDALGQKIEMAAVANGIKCPTEKQNRDILNLTQSALDCQVKTKVLEAQLSACAKKEQLIILNQPSNRNFKEDWEQFKKDIFD